MVIDSSAILAIVLDKPEAQLFVSKLLNTPRSLLSAGTMVEIAAVATRRFSGRLDARIDYVLTAIAPSVVAVTPLQARIASAAYRRYGSGNTHPAKLNFGYCFSYALAKETGEPLLFKGDNFTHTDIASAL